MSCQFRSERSNRHVTLAVIIDHIRRPLQIAKQVTPWLVRILPPLPGDLVNYKLRLTKVSRRLGNCRAAPNS